MCVTGMGSPIEKIIVSRSEEKLRRGISLGLVRISLQDKTTNNEVLAVYNMSFLDTGS
jgi:hypothetical protein